MGIQTIAQLEAARERAQVVANESAVKRSFLERHPELDRDCNWGIIRRGIGDGPMTVTTAEQSAGANGSLLVVISPEELQAEQVQMADGICASQFQKTFRPSERESWSAKIYGMNQEKRKRYLVQLPRMELKSLVELETCRPAVLAKIKASRPAYDANTLLGGRAAYEAALAAELEQYASMDIEELGKVAVQLRAADVNRESARQLQEEIAAGIEDGPVKTALRDEVHDAYVSRHPEAVGAQPVRSFAEARKYNDRSQRVEQRNSSGGEVVISYTRAELINMDPNEFRILFQRPNGNGGFEYKPGYAQAITRILQGELTEAAQLRDQALRNRI